MRILDKSAGVHVWPRQESINAAITITRYIDIDTRGASPVDEEPWIPVKSSNLKEVRHNDGERILHIKFHGDRVYRYSGVPKSVFDSLMNSTSLGSYFHAHIKGKFDDRRVYDED